MLESDVQSHSAIANKHFRIILVILYKKLVILNNSWKKIFLSFWILKA